MEKRYVEQAARLSRSCSSESTGSSRGSLGACTARLRAKPVQKITSANDRAAPLAAANELTDRTLGRNLCLTARCPRGKPQVSDASGGKGVNSQIAMQTRHRRSSLRTPRPERSPCTPPCRRLEDITPAF